MSLADHLKEATATAHRDAEQRELQRQLVQGTLEETALTAYLEQLRLLHGALERHVAAQPAVAGWLQWSDDYHHSERLAADLAALDAAGAHPAVPETTALLTDIDKAIAAEPAALVGFLYVLEGSMNGNRFIVRALKHGPMGARCPFAYFDPYGEAQRERWGQFRGCIDAAPLDETQQRAVHAAADRMFAGIGAVSDGVRESHTLSA